ncbi:MAG TPA: hypothetical protein VEY06_01480 [Flavisolibacter sp.]|nr:hypothetical protein [Flavisolibacter sp.]
MKGKRIEPQRFSEYFGLNAKSEDLDFLDVYANQDIELFLDPYGIAAIGTAWSRKCELYITGFFQFLIDCIKVGDKKSINTLLNALHEVDEVSLGYSLGKPSGRGIGSVQAKEILAAFENSQAAKSGDIKDIADCALMIHGINRDKISDITANILKKPLIEFTQEQCNKFKIPLKRIPVNNAFNYETLSFTSFYTELPVINGSPKILLPITSVRRDPQLSKDKYYRNFVLEFLRAEHEHAGDALASILRNGRVVVRKKDLQNKYPMTTDFLYQFSKDHPKILEKFKTELRRTAINKRTPALQPNKKILKASDRAGILSNLKTGNEDASNYHKISYDNLIHIFGVRLSNPDSEVEINNGRKRIDIVFNNTDSSGFFKSLYQLHQIKCPKIFVECKNYGKEIGNPEIDQLQGRFSDRRGNFGLLLCRSIADRQKIIERCRDVMNDKKGYIIVLDDRDIVTLLNLKEEQNEKGIDDFFTKKLDELIM